MFPPNSFILYFNKHDSFKPHFAYLSGKKFIFHLTLPKYDDESTAALMWETIRKERQRQSLFELCSKTERTANIVESNKRDLLYSIFRTLSGLRHPYCLYIVWAKANEREKEFLRLWEKSCQLFCEHKIILLGIFMKMWQPPLWVWWDACVFAVGEIVVSFVQARMLW